MILFNFLRIHIAKKCKIQIHLSYKPLPVFLLKIVLFRELTLGKNAEKNYFL
jgi:hypothetical protein